MRKRAYLSPKRSGVLSIRRSCLTGKVVWVYWAKTRRAANTAYYKAKREEIKMYGRWGETATQRRKNVMGIINEWLDALPITAMIPKDVEEAIREIRALSKEEIASHREFYEHIMEENRRRKNDAILRQKMKEKVL